MFRFLLGLNVFKFALKRQKIKDFTWKKIPQNVTASASEINVQVTDSSFESYMSEPNKLASKREIFFNEEH